MTEAVRFFSCLQTGLAGQLEQQAGEDGVPLQGQATIAPQIGVGGLSQTFSQSMDLRGPGDVMRLDPGAVAMMEPASNERDVAPNFFPYVELIDATLPWMFTPAGPNADGQLMPWLVLVVVPKAADVTLTKLARVPGMKLSIGAGAGGMLPNLQQSHAWAHVEDRCVSADAAAAFAANPEDFVARLMCPIRMEPNAAYIAALVPAFEAGRQAGLGREVTETGPAFAWGDETEALDLPVYHHWDFATGEQDFEALVRRLKGIPVAPSTGVHDLDISNPRGGMDIGMIMGRQHAKKRILVSYKGALTAPAARARKWDASHQKPFQQAMRASLTPEVTKPKGRAGYRATRHDPVITAPVYGSFQKDRALFEGSKARWMNEANLDPQNRANAGLGARSVRRNQEQLMGKAWARAKGVPDVQAELRNGRVALSVGTKVHARLSALPAPQYIQMTTAVQPSIVAGQAEQMSITGQLEAVDSLPDGVLSPAFRRSAALTQIRVKSIDQSPAAPKTLQLSVTQRSLSGQAALLTDQLPAIDVGARQLGTYSINGVTLNPAQSLSTLANRVGLRVGSLTATTAGPTLRPLHGTAVLQERDITGIIGRMARVERAHVKIAKSTAATPVAATKQAIVGATRPAKVLPDVVFERVEGVDRPPAKRVEIPRTPILSVSFPEPAYGFLNTGGSEFLLPGFGAVADHSVSLLQTNTQFVETYLLGLNHELSREFAWRQFPAALNSTWFQRFWDYTDDPVRTDIIEIARWQNTRRIGGASGKEDAVVLVKSPLFRRYPDTLVYAVPAKWVKASDLGEDATGQLRRTAATKGKGKVRVANFDRAEDILYPHFSGKIGTAAAFFGFDTDPLSLTGTETPDLGKGPPGYFIVFEQAPSNQKFGLDQARGFGKTAAPRLADNLSWGHFAESADALRSDPFATTLPVWAETAIEGARWGRNSAETAQLALQSPVRIMFHASGLMDIEEGWA